jgi:hypothetical protein
MSISIIMRITSEETTRLSCGMLLDLYDRNLEKNQFRITLFDYSYYLPSIPISLCFILMSHLSEKGFVQNFNCEDEDCVIADAHNLDDAILVKVCSVELSSEGIQRIKNCIKKNKNIKSLSEGDVAIKEISGKFNVIFKDITFSFRKNSAPNKVLRTMERCKERGSVKLDEIAKEFFGANETFREKEAKDKNKIYKAIFDINAKAKKEFETEDKILFLDRSLEIVNRVH